MSELTRERIKEIRGGGTNMARRAAIHGWLIKICDMALRTLDAEARNRKLEAALRDIARGPLQEPMDFATYAKNVAANALTTAPPDSEPAEGEGGGDCCLIWSGEHRAYWRPNEAGYTHNIADAGRYSWPEARKIVAHCGPEKKVELITAPGATPSQRRDAGDILREKLSDPEAMQRVTERAAERQDAMLGRREALEEAAMTALQHLHWAACRKAPCMDEDTAKVLSSQVRRALSRTSDEGTGCVVPESIRRLTEQWQEEYDDLLAGDDGMQEYLRGKRDAGHELDRAIAEQGGQR